MWSKHSLIIYIENKRKEMMEAANCYGLSADITIKHSQELDELLNYYSRNFIENQGNKVANY